MTGPIAEFSAHLDCVDAACLSFFGSEADLLDLHFGSSSAGSAGRFPCSRKALGSRGRSEDRARLGHEAPLST